LLVGLCSTALRTVEMSSVSLHDVLPFCPAAPADGAWRRVPAGAVGARTAIVPRQARHPTYAVAAHVRPDRTACYRWPRVPFPPADRKSTRLNSSHVKISYAVFCLQKVTA